MGLTNTKTETIKSIPLNQVTARYIPIAESFLCQKCDELPFFPVQCMNLNCSSFTCYSCLDDTQSRCQKCKDFIFKKLVDEEILHMVRVLKVKCSRKCGTVIDYGDLTPHLESCITQAPAGLSENNLYDTTPTERRDLGRKRKRCDETIEYHHRSQPVTKISDDEIKSLPTKTQIEESEKSQHNEIKKNLEKLQESIKVLSSEVNENKLNKEKELEKTKDNAEVSLNSQKMCLNHKTENIFKPQPNIEQILITKNINNAIYPQSQALGLVYDPVKEMSMENIRLRAMIQNHNYEKFINQEQLNRILAINALQQGSSQIETTQILRQFSNNI
jgi:hypothetical protein